MSNSSEFRNIYSGSEVRVIMLKGLLAEAGIDAIEQNEFQSGIVAGFGGGTINTIRLKVHEDDLDKAKGIVDEFINNPQ